MNPPAPSTLRLAAAALTLATAVMSLVFERRDGARALVTALALVALAAIAGGLATPANTWAVPGMALAVAVLVALPDDRLRSECALKLAWVVAPALALAFAADHLLTLAAGTARPAEQWTVLALDLDPPTLWRTALPLMLLAGLALCGAAPFHGWLADLLHGVRAPEATLIAPALQSLGAGWVVAHLAGIELDPGAATLAADLLGVGAVVALLGGAATLATQRRPERRAGTLASLQGGMVVAMLIARVPEVSNAPLIDAWTAHLMLALAGTAVVARFLPTGEGIAPAAALFRRHPFSGAAGLFAIASLAGVPGTPGMRLWLETGASLSQGGRTLPMLALGTAWVTGFVVVVRDARSAFGVPAPGTPVAGDVPLPSRLALWASAAGLVLFGLAWGWRG